MVASKIERIDRPKGQAEHYRFFRHRKTGKRFKVRHLALVASDSSPAIQISVAPVDRSNRAERDANGNPDLHVHTHTFTPVELSDPTFSPDERLDLIIEHAIDMKARALRVRGWMSELGERWAQNPEK